MTTNTLDSTTNTNTQQTDPLLDNDFAADINYQDPNAFGAPPPSPKKQGAGINWIIVGPVVFIILMVGGFIGLKMYSSAKKEAQAKAIAIQQEQERIAAQQAAAAAQQQAQQQAAAQQNAGPSQSDAVQDQRIANIERMMAENDAQQKAINDQILVLTQQMSEMNKDFKIILQGRANPSREHLYVGDPKDARPQPQPIKKGTLTSGGKVIGDGTGRSPKATASLKIREMIGQRVWLFKPDVSGAVDFSATTGDELPDGRRIIAISEIDRTATLSDGTVIIAE